MVDEIRVNLVFLIEHLGNLEQILDKFEEEGIFSSNDVETLLLGNKTTEDRNREFFKLLRKTDWPNIRDLVLQCFNDTNNGHCANVILGMSPDDIAMNNRKSGITKKWWPEEQKLPLSFYKRQVAGASMVEQLRNILSKTTTNEAIFSHKLIISGLGGIGKTTMARWYADEYQEEYDQIFWFNCGRENLYCTFLNLCEFLNIKGRDGADIKTLAQLCFDKLRCKKCLFIYDNAECYVGPDGIRNVLPIDGDKDLHCIITSRHTEWGTEYGHGKIEQIKLDVFEMDEAIGFLQKNLSSNGSNAYLDNELQDLAILLGCYPLALQITVGLLKRNKQPPMANYIDNFKMILTSNVNFECYDKSIVQTMQLSIKSIGKSGDDDILANKILQILGYIQADNIPLGFLASVLQTDSEKIINATAILSQYSLVSENSDCELNPKNSLSSKSVISVHRMVQYAIRHIFEGEEPVILRQILSSKGYLEEKILPCEFASHHGDALIELCNKVFQNSAADNVLERLIGQNRNDEALMLSEMFCRTYKKFRTKAILSSILLCVLILLFYALCLWVNSTLFEVVALVFGPLVVFIIHFFCSRRSYTMFSNLTIIILYILFSIDGILTIGFISYGIILDHFIFNGKAGQVAAVVITLVLTLFRAVYLTYNIDILFRIRKSFRYNKAVCLARVGKLKDATDLFHELHIRHGIIERLRLKLTKSTSTSLRTLRTVEAPQKIATDVWLIHLRSQIGQTINWRLFQSLTNLNKIEIWGSVIPLNLYLFKHITSLAFRYTKLFFLAKEERENIIDNGNLITRILILVKVTFLNSKREELKAITFHKFFPYELEALTVLPKELFTSIKIVPYKTKAKVINNKSNSQLYSKINNNDESSCSEQSNLDEEATETSPLNSV